MPWVGKTMDRKASAARAAYRAKTWCLTHGRMLEWCQPLDASCAVCVCGPECIRPCPEPRRPNV